MAIPRTAVIICMLIASPVAPAPANAMATVSTSAPATYVADTEHWTNVRRVERERVKLRDNSCLERMAVAQAGRLARRGELFHQDLRRVQSECGMGYAGENVAYGYPDGKGVVRAWMASAGHRANILTKAYRLIGVGAVKKDGVWWVAQVFGTKA